MYVCMSMWVIFNLEQTKLNMYKIIIFTFNNNKVYFSLKLTYVFNKQTKARTVLLVKIVIRQNDNDKTIEKNPAIV